MVMFWDIATLLTSDYVIYVKINLYEGVEMKDLLLHYEFCRDIALYWIDKALYDEGEKIF